MFLSDIILESTTPKHAAFCFGRMNPPTVGHEQLIQTVGREAEGGDYFIFVSQTQDAKKNPLSYQQKIHYLRALYPGMASHFVLEPGLKTIMQVAEWLYKKGYTSVTFVAGSDRLPEFEKLLNTYNGMEGKNVYYKFDRIEFVSSGERDPDSDGISGVSASMAREAAVNGDFETFAKAVDAGELTQQMYDAVRAGMGVQDAELAEGRRALPPGWSGKKWRPNIPANKTPKEEPEKTDEGWKGALAGAALVGGIGAAMVAGNPLTIGDVQYQQNSAGPDSPEEFKTSHIITHNGKKYQTWKGTGAKPRNRAWFYRELTPQQDNTGNLGFNKDKWKNYKEIEPTDLWVNEDIAVDNKRLLTFLRAVTDWWNAKVDDANRIYFKEPGMRVWTRGDGTRMRDPAKLLPAGGSQDDTQVINALWDALSKLAGAKPAGTVSQEFPSLGSQDAISYKGFTLVKRNSSIDVMTRSRVKNPNSVWKQTNESLATRKQRIEEEITQLESYIANSNNGGGAGMLEAVNKLKLQLVEMFGPMGGDQRNMRGSQERIKEPASFTGSVTVSYPMFKDYATASKYGVKVVDTGGSDKNLTITGNKQNIKKFLVASGWNSSDLRNWYPELHEDGADSWAVEINGETVPAHNQDHAMNKARNALSYKKADVVYILHNGKKAYSWKLGEKIQQLTEATVASLEKKIQTKKDALGMARERRRMQAQKGGSGMRTQSDREVKLQGEITRLESELRALTSSHIKECSGYIPKNAKEAKDPRWSNALSVDVGIDTPAKNLKAFGL